MTRKNKKNKSKGWPDEPIRHSLAGQGVKTVINDKWRFNVNDFVARGKGNRLTAEDVERLKVRIESLEDMDLDDVRIKKDYGITQIHLATDGGHKEFVVVGDWDKAKHLAERKVIQQLKHEPHLFNESFLKQHGYVSNKRFILDDERDMAYEMFQERGFEGEELNEKINEYIDDKRKEIEKNPWRYFEDMGYDTEQILDEFISFDYEEVAEEAVRTDGEGHFLSTYDGEVREMPDSEAVYWRVN